MGSGIKEYLKAFAIKRNELLIEMDEEKIRRFYAEHETTLPSDPVAFWGSVHKARCNILSMPEAEKSASRAWLAAHGMNDMTSK